MHDAAALVEAGFIVTIVDIESDRTRPAKEDIGGVYLKHIFMPSYFDAARFKHWFLIDLVMIMVYGTIQLLRIKADIYHVHVERAFPACYEEVGAAINAMLANHDGLAHMRLNALKATRLEL